MKKKSPKPVKTFKKQTNISGQGFMPPAYGINFVDKQNNSNDAAVQGVFESSPKDNVFFAQKKENRTGLPDKLKEGIENLSGYSMDDVEVRYNSDKPAQLHAHAYTQGTEIHLASGQEKHLPHEAWHVVQQKRGLVKPTMQMNGKVNVNDEAGLEKEADVMGAKALQKSSQTASQVNTKGLGNQVAQQKSIEHNKGCGCCSCSPQMTRQENFQNSISGAPIQRCVSCGDSSCVKGEKCGYDRSEGGLFSGASSSSALPVLPYGSSSAKKNSGKAFGTELEHPIPGQALRLTGQGSGYKQEYTIPIPVAVHRGGVSGSGGGISSTGSSATSKGWSKLLASQDDFGQVKSALTDQINSQLMNNNFNEQTAVQLKDWLVSQRDQSGRISQAEYETLLNILMNRYLNQS
jgi:hypothetical protein